MPTHVEAVQVAAYLVRNQKMQEMPEEVGSKLAEALVELEGIQFIIQTTERLATEAIPIVVEHIAAELPEAEVEGGMEVEEAFATAVEGVDQVIVLAILVFESWTISKELIVEMAL